MRCIGVEPQLVSVDVLHARQHDRKVIRSVDAGEGVLHSFELEEVQGLYALRRGDVIALRLIRAAKLWWFVERVNGPEQAITARTVIFDLVQEQDFPFSSVMRHEPEDAAEANHWRPELGMPLKDDETVRASRKLRRAACRHASGGCSSWTNADPAAATPTAVTVCAAVRRHSAGRPDLSRE